MDARVLTQDSLIVSGVFRRVEASGPVYPLRGN
jgi:hypothetical protein